jgi:tetratricopeptide (TPR) repeat protein
MGLSGNGGDQFGPVELEIGSKPLKVIGLCLLISTFVAILYFNSLGNQFTNWDDGMIYMNPHIRNLSWEGMRKIFTFTKGNTYQPIRMFSYAVDYQFWKLNPLGYRLTNILFYVLTCIMVFLTLRQLSTSLRDKVPPDSHERVALFGSLLFAAHPVHVEAVTWLSARKEVLQGFFFFSGCYFYFKGREELRQRKTLYYFALALLFIFLAILSKPSAVVFPAIVLLYEIARKKEGFMSFLKRHWLFLGLSLIVSALFTFILMKVMVEAGGIKPYHGVGVVSNILVTVYAFLRNIKLLIFAGNYSPAYEFVVHLPVLCLKNVLSILITLALFIVSLVSLKWTKLIFFSFFFFLITLLPYLNIIPISTVLADRYVFIASLSYCFLLGILFDYVYRHRLRRFSAEFFKLLSISVCLLLLIGYSFMTIQQNKIWRNSFTLWLHAVENQPESSTANAMMGVVYMELRMDAEAIKHLEKAVQLLPYDYLSRNNLGVVYGRQNEPEKALKELMTAMVLKPDEDSIKINLSVFYLRQKEYKKAEEILKHLLSKSPENANLHFRLGLLYKDAGRYEEAISEYLRSVELAPHIINGYEELGNIYASKVKDLGKAKYYYTRGIEAVPKAKARVEDLRWMIQDLENHKSTMRDGP